VPRHDGDVARLVYSMLEGICALPHDRKQESPQRHRATEQKDQMISLILFSVPLCLCGDSCFLSVIKDRHCCPEFSERTARKCPSDKGFSMILAGVDLNSTSLTGAVVRADLAGCHQ
jgi:hypothetical protein